VTPSRIGADQTIKPSSGRPRHVLRAFRSLGTPSETLKPCNLGSDGTEKDTIGPDDRILVPTDKRPSRCHLRARLEDPCGPKPC